MTCSTDAYGVHADFRLHNKPVNAMWEFSKVRAAPPCGLPQVLNVKSQDLRARADATILGTARLIIVMQVAASACSLQPLECWAPAMQVFVTSSSHCGPRHSFQEA
jgi:hypothetical protein